MTNPEPRVVAYSALAAAAKCNTRAWRIVKRVLPDIDYGAPTVGTLPLRMEYRVNRRSDQYRLYHAVNRRLIDKMIARGMLRLDRSSGKCRIVASFADLELAA